MMKRENTVCQNRISKYINCEDFSAIRDELRTSSCSICEIRNVKDVIFRSGTEKNKGRTNLLDEKYILRWRNDNHNDIELIKECSNGGRVKSITEKISTEAVKRIFGRSTKWLCTSISPLLREFGIKMTTERLRPESVMSFERESFDIENRLFITADSGIVLCDYKKELAMEDIKKSDPIDKNICLLQINYDRIIPENISSLIGIKAH